MAPAGFRTAPGTFAGRSFQGYRAPVRQAYPGYRVGAAQVYRGYRVAGRPYYGVRPAPVGALGMQQRADYRWNRAYASRYGTRYAWDSRRQWDRNDWRRYYRDRYENRRRIVVSTNVRGPYYWPGYSYYSPYYYSPYYYIRDYPSYYPVVSAAYDYGYYEPYDYVDYRYSTTVTRPVYYGSAVLTSRVIAARVQRELAVSGYYRGPIDGIVGPRTRAAIAAYQRDHRLPVTARVDTLLLRSLGMV